MERGCRQKVLVSESGARLRVPLPGPEGRQLGLLRRLMGGREEPGVLNKIREKDTRRHSYA
jgi:hypothetical protein